jgi:CRISPR-associated protein Cas6
MSDETSAVIDVVYDLQGTYVPAGYAFSLWREIVRCLPWIEQVQHVGIVPLRGSESDGGTLLSQRTKLVLRLPAALAQKALELSGQQLNVDGSVLKVGQARERELKPSTTVHAYIVESELGEVEFLADMNAKLQEMKIPCKLICSKQITVRSKDKTLQGYGLVLHDLKPDASLQIQRVGLGGSRRYGCGMFVHYKAISGLD